MDQWQVGSIYLLHKFIVQGTFLQHIFQYRLGAFPVEVYTPR